MPQDRYASVIVQGASADVELVAGSGTLFGAALTADGVAASSVTLYDGPIASGKKIGKVAAPAAGFNHAYPPPVKFTTSLRAVVVGAAAEALVYQGPA